MANIYKSNYTGEQIDNSVGLTQVNTATQGQVLTANGAGGASWQDASVGTEVVANPTSEATEELSKLQVGSNVYSIPKGGGKQLYHHSIRLSLSDGSSRSATVFVQVISSMDVAYIKSSFMQYLRSIASTGTSQTDTYSMLSCTGWGVYDSYKFSIAAIGASYAESYNNDSITLACIRNDFFGTSYTFYTMNNIYDLKIVAL